MAKYINSVAQAGKDAYPLPMCLNVWMGGPGSNAFGRPGDAYPSGGGQAHTLDLWKAAAPAIDVIAPDIYDRSAVVYRKALSDYARPDNPLLLVETGEGKEFARYCFMALGEYSAIGLAQFGVGIKEYGATSGDFGPQFADMAADYRLLGNAAPVDCGTARDEEVASGDRGGEYRAPLALFRALGCAGAGSLQRWAGHSIGGRPGRARPCRRAACCWPRCSRTSS